MDTSNAEYNGNMKSTSKYNYLPFRYALVDSLISCSLHYKQAYRQHALSLVSNQGAVSDEYNAASEHYRVYWLSWAAAEISAEL